MPHRSKGPAKANSFLCGRGRLSHDPPLFSQRPHLHKTRPHEHPRRSVQEQPGMGRANSPPGSRVFRQALAPAVAHLPVDRLRRQPRARQPDRRLAAGRHLRASQSRQHGGAHRSQLPVGHAVRGRHPQGQAHHRRRPLWMQRRAGGHAPLARRPRRQLAAPRAGRAREARAFARRLRQRRRRGGPSVRAERHRAGRERLPDHDRARRLGARPGVVRARLDLRHRRRPGARSRHHRLRFPRGRACVPGRARQARRSRRARKHERRGAAASRAHG